MIVGEEGQGRRRMEISTRACSTGNLLFVTHRGQGEGMEMGDRKSQSETPTLPTRAMVIVTFMSPGTQHGWRERGEALCWP